MHPSTGVIKNVAQICAHCHNTDLFLSQSSWQTYNKVLTLSGEGSWIKMNSCIQRHEWVTLWTISYPHILMVSHVWPQDGKLHQLVNWWIVTNMMKPRENNCGEIKVIIGIQQIGQWYVSCLGLQAWRFFVQAFMIFHAWIHNNSCTLAKNMLVYTVHDTLKNQVLETISA